MYTYVQNERGVWIPLLVGGAFGYVLGKDINNNNSYNYNQMPYYPVYYVTPVNNNCYNYPNYPNY